MAQPPVGSADQEPTADAGRSREIFVYYQVDPAAAATLAPSVREAQAALVRRHPGLVARFLQREQREQRGDADASMQTWMETYAFEGERNAGIEPDLQLLIESGMAATAAIAATGPGIVGARHIEVFFVKSR